MVTLTKSFQEVAYTEYWVGGGGYLLRLYGKYNSQSAANNKTNVTFELRTLAEASGSSYYSSGNSCRLTFGGTDRGTQYFNIGTVTATEKTIGTWTFDVTHGTDGTYKTTASGWADVYAGVEPSLSGEVTLPTIPRYFSKDPVVTLNKKDETSFSCSWTTSENCNQVRYSLNNGSSWTTASTTSAKTGTFNVSSLTANTTYNIQFEFKKADSGLLSTISAQQTTYAYPYITAISPTANSVWSMSGSSQSLSMTLYNPLKRSVKGQILIIDPLQTTIRDIAATTGTSLTLSISKQSINRVITHSQSATITYKCLYSIDGENYTISSITLSNSYQLREADCKPTISNLTYTDGNSTTLNVIGNSGKTLVQNYSIVKATVGSVTCLYGATPKTISITLGTKTVSWNVNSSNPYNKAVELGKFNYQSGTVTMTATVTDSRGWTASVEKNVTFITYQPPQISIEAQRTGGYGTNATFTVNAKYTSLKIGGNEKNAWLNNNTAYVRYNISPTPSTPAASGNVANTNPITNKTIDITGADNDLIYTITIYANDKITSASATATFGKGQPTFSVCTDNQTVGVNTVPPSFYNPGLYVNGVLGFANSLGEGFQEGMISSEGRMQRIIESNIPLRAKKMMSKGDISVDGDAVIEGTLTVGSKTLLDWIYPVGSIYMSVKSTNPGTLFGGTWVAWGAGRVPVGIDTSQTEFKTVEKTGGSKNMQKHTHTRGTMEITGSFYGDEVSRDAGVTATGAFSTPSSGGTGKFFGSGYSYDLANGFDFKASDSWTGETSEAGTGTSGNLQPYITCYMWKRTA